MLGGGPLTHIVSAFGHQPEHCVRTESMDLRQVGAQQSIKCRSRVEARFVPALRMPHAGQWFFRSLPLLVEQLQSRLDLHVALSDLGLMEIIKLQRLA